MLYNNNQPDEYTTHASNALMKLSKLFAEIQNQELSSIEESELPLESILLRELSKPILEEKKLNHIKKKGSFPKITNPKEERNIKLIFDVIKKYKGYEQFIILHKICEKSLMIMFALGTIEKYKKGETIYAKKDIADKFYYIIKGDVSVKAFDQKKIMEEYQNKIQNYKNKKNNNFISEHNDNTNSLEKDKTPSPFYSFNSITRSFSKSDYNDSSSVTLNNINKDLFKNKMNILGKIKLSTIPKKSKIIRNNIEKKTNIESIVLSKRRKPLYYINNFNENSDTSDNCKLVEENNNSNDNNINSNKKDIYMKSFNELQQILQEQREQ